MNTSIRQAEGILDTREGQQPRLAGCRVTFDTGDCLIVLSQGDEVAVPINSLPPACAEIRRCFVTGRE